MIKNYWKYIVFTLLGGVMLFHIAALWYIIDRGPQVTSKDYYERDLGYQDRIHELRAGLAFDWHIEFTGRSLSVRVLDEAGRPIQLTNAQAVLYRPSEAALDRRVTLIETDEDGTYTAYYEALAAGRWDLTITCEHNGQAIARQSKEAL